MNKLNALYTGKAKTLYESDQGDRLICEFRNDTSAFDGTKVAQLTDKGRVNNQFNAFIMTHLAEQGIENHFDKRLDDTHCLVKRLDMIPVECVVRNIAAGSLCKRLGIEYGRALTPATFEFFLKNDALHDPMINEAHILTFGWATQQEIELMRQKTLVVNEHLKTLFDNAGLILVDYKLEFGRYQGKILLGDEITPDGCRIWDKDTRQILDKDRFRKEMGDVVESYQHVAKRLGIEIDKAYGES